MSALRSAAVAGQFYPHTADDCRAQIEACLAEAEAIGRPDLPSGFRAVAGLAPHAGWVCSGAVAGQVIRVLAAGQAVQTFVVFGAVHRRMAIPAAVFAEGAWETPLGSIAIDEELAADAVRSSPLLRVEPEVHEPEHSIEVEVPFIQYLAPRARLLPVMVSPVAEGPEIGRAVARAATALGRRVVYLGSTDLTHYGPRYAFVPGGVGPEGLRWAKEENDRRMLDLVTSLQAEEVVHEALTRRNACGPGAVAATLAAARASGADTVRVLRHTNSNEVLCTRYGQMEDAVGYAGVVMGTIDG